MSDIDIPVRYDYGYESLSLPLTECAFLLVDVDGTAPNLVTEERIGPSLAAVRAAGLRVAYVHNDLLRALDRLHQNGGRVHGRL